MDSKTVTLFDLEDKPIDTVIIPLNSEMRPGAVLNYMGRKFVRGGGHNSFYGPNEYGEKRTDES